MNFILVINLLYAQYNLCQSVLANNEFTTVFLSVLNSFVTSVNSIIPLLRP